MGTKQHGPNKVDLHIGMRLLRRRRLLGLTQEQLAKEIGVTFQQIQKFECAGTRITASSLYKLALALNVPVGYFYEGLEVATPANDTLKSENDTVSLMEAIEFISLCYTLSDEARRQLLSAARRLEEAPKEIR